MNVPASSETQVVIKEDGAVRGSAREPEPEYRLTFVDSALPPVSLFRQIWQSLHEPKVTVPREYYRGKVALPATDMRPWILDIPNQLRALFEKPKITASTKEYYRGRATLPATDMRPWIFDLPNQLKALFEKPPAIPITSKPVDVPEMWQDYQPQSGSWLNSLLVHAVGIAVILLPFFVSRINQPVKASTKYEPVIDISPYLPDLEAAGKKAGGGGGGGDRSPLPASKGAAPRFARQQLAPPLAVIRNPHPILQVEPTLLGAPQLKLPQMAINSPVWGDPLGVAGPPSNGPGTGGGIGSGEGTGIGSGKGGGLGPGEGGGFGGGAYSVGGGVSAPVPIYDPEPAYSEEARKAKYQGTVVLWIVVDPNGAVTDARVVRPLGLGLDEKALETVRTWKFKPGMRNGVPVPVRCIVEVTFRLF